MTKKIQETASAGSTGAHAIAVNPGRMGTEIKKRDLKTYMVKYMDTMGNTMRLTPVNIYKLDKNKKVKVVSALKENFNLDSVLAQLSSFENKTTAEQDNVVTYGVEDDKGNLMKVTILDTQADDFESYISSYLSELRNFKEQGVDLEDISLAELLYRLKDVFDIRNVEFPNIPEDIVYNADETSENVDDSMLDDGVGDDLGEDGFGDEEFGDEGDEFDMGGGDLGGDEFSDEGDEFDLEGEDEFDEFSDDESVEDFEDVEDESSTNSVLTSILDMLKTQAEAERAKAEAAAEEARAEQARVAQVAAEITLSKKEEEVAMEAEKSAEKAREKAAKKEADLATYRYKKGKGMLDAENPKFEGFTENSILLNVLQEEEVIRDERLLIRQREVERRNLMMQLADAQTDEEKRAIRDQLNLLPRKYQLKQQELRARKELDIARDEDGGDELERGTADPENIREKFEVITEEEYEKLDEAVKRQFKRYGNKFVRKYRCYGGPKHGKIVSTPSACGIRKDPFKVRRGRRSARMKKGQRVRKTQLAKKKSPSKRLVRMNKLLRGK